MLYDAAWEEFDQRLVSADPLKFQDTKAYAARLRDGRDKTASLDALVSAVGSMGGVPTVIAAMEYGFIGGSMGVVVGEKVTRAVERATRERLPIIVVSCSGGARMMEGTLSLMQMAKISAALARHDEAGLPFISLLTDPTTGGVTASYAMLGDLNVSEPGALIGFAGPRVIEQTIRQKLPAGFQRAEFLRDHGMVDMVVDRRELKKSLVRSLKLLLG
jgi:acetyl-CoA carboxylase carboxyl transferase subunit beta